MKNMRNIVIGIIIGLILSVPANAAVQEYALKQSEWKVVVDGQVVQDEKLPVLLMEPGYNYLPAGAFRTVCEKAGIGFTADVDSKEIRISTKQEVAAMSTKTAPAPTPVTIQAEYTEPYTLMRDGIKKAFIGDIYKLLKPTGYHFERAMVEGNFKDLYSPDDKLVFQNVPYTIHEYQGEGKIFIDYDFYEQNIKPLITN